MWGILGAVVLAPATANAEPLAMDRFEPERQWQLLGAQGIHIDTGWQPPNSAIQVKFLVHAQDDVLASMPGEAVYDWGTSEVVFFGDEGEGTFEIDVGAIVDARVQFDLLGNHYESELIGPYELGVFELTELTPYLLEGNPDRPALIEVTTEKTEVIAYPLVDAVIASGELVVDAAFDVRVALACSRIDVTPVEGSTATVDVELAAAALQAPSEEGVDLEAVGKLSCTTTADVTLLLYPGVQVTIGLEQFELAPFELPVPLLTGQEDPFDFDALPLRFEAPPAPSGTTSDSGGDESSGGPTHSGGGGDGGMTASDTGGNDPGTTSSTDGSDTDSATGGGVSDQEGCACRAGETRQSWGLLLVGMLGLARRRRSAQARSCCRRACSARSRTS